MLSEKKKILFLYKQNLFETLKSLVHIQFIIYIQFLVTYSALSDFRGILDIFKRRIKLHQMPPIVKEMNLCLELNIK